MEDGKYVLSRSGGMACPNPARQAAQPSDVAAPETWSRRSWQGSLGLGLHGVGRGRHPHESTHCAASRSGRATHVPRGQPILSDAIASR